MILCRNSTDSFGKRQNVSSDRKLNPLCSAVVYIKIYRYILVVFHIILVSACSSSDDADTFNSDTDSIDTTLSGTDWTVISLQRDDGEVIEIPAEANWKASFISSAINQAEILELRYNCRSFRVEYVLTGSVFSTDNDPSFSDGVCVDPGLVLGGLEAFVESTLTNNIFIFERDGSDALSLTSGDNEVIRMFKD